MGPSASAVPAAAAAADAAPDNMLGDDGAAALAPLLECSKTLRVLNVKRTASDVFVFTAYLLLPSGWRMSLHNQSNQRL